MLLELISTVMTCVINTWKLLLLLLRFVGQQIDIEIGVAFITILGLGNPGFVRIGEILLLVVQKVNMGTRVAILTILGFDISGFVQTGQYELPSTLGLWSDFRILIYVTAAALVIFSQSDLMAGVAYTGAVIEVFFVVYRHLSLEYQYVLTGVLVHFVVMVVVHYGFTPDRAYQRRMRL